MRKIHNWGRMFLFSLFCLSTSLAKAQQNYVNSTYLEVSPIFNVNGGNSVALDLKYGKNWALNEVFALGASVGLEEELHFRTWKPNIPVLVRGTFDMNTKEISPFLMIDFGYNICTQSFKQGGLIVNPALGVRVKNYYVGAGYLASISLNKGGETGHNINVRAGYYFNSGKADLGSFFRKTYVTAEVGSGISLGQYHNCGESGESDPNSQMSNLSTALYLNWLYKIDKHWSAGIGAGARIYYHTEKYDGNSHVYSERSESEVTTAIPLYLKGQYVFKEEGEKIRPFVACNLGLSVDMGSDWKHSDSGLLFEPQVGIVYNDKYSISLGYDPTAAYYRWGGNDDDGKDINVAEKFSELSLRVGIKF